MIIFMYILAAILDFSLIFGTCPTRLVLPIRITVPGVYADLLTKFHPSWSKKNGISFLEYFYGIGIPTIKVDFLFDF